MSSVTDQNLKWQWRYKAADSTYRGADPESSSGQQSISEDKQKQESVDCRLHVYDWCE